MCTIYEANMTVILHLKEIIDNFKDSCKNVHLSRMIDTLIENNNVYPIDKTSRWIGFIHGVLYSQGYIDLEKEHNFTRPIYHTVYRDSDIVIPDTLDLHSD